MWSISRMREKMINFEWIREVPCLEQGELLKEKWKDIRKADASQ